MRNIAIATTGEQILHSGKVWREKIWREKIWRIDSFQAFDERKFGELIDKLIGYQL